MAYDVTGLSAWTEETKQEIITTLSLGSRSAQLLTKMSGVKGTESLNIATCNITVADGSSCGFTAAGDTVLTQRDMAVTELTVNKEWCPRDFNGFWSQTLLNAGSDNEGNEPEAVIVNKIMDLINTDNETTIWRGKASPAISGIVHHVDALSGTCVLTSTGTAWATNEIAIMRQLYEDLPVEVLGKDNLRVFMPYSYAREYKSALVAANLYHYPASNDEQSFFIHGTDVRIEVVEGLTGSSRIIAATTDNLFVGCDLENEHEQLKFWFSEDSDVIRMRADWKIGTQVAFPAMITVYQGS